MKKKNSKKIHSTKAVLAIVICIITAFIGAIIYYQLSRAPKADSSASVTSSESSGAVSEKSSQKVDARKYYRENSEKLLSVTPADKSEKVYSEKDIAKELSSRGFGKNSEITFDYGIDGTLKSKTKIDSSSSVKHPQYSLTYITKNGDYWNINVCNNCITAYPVTYNLEHGKGTELIIAETSSITAYDSETNAFYQSIPKQNVLILKQIPAVTAEALERLTAQEIDKL